MAENRKLKTVSYLKETLGILNIENLFELKNKLADLDKVPIEKIKDSGLSELSQKLNQALSLVESQEIDRLIDIRIDKLSYHLSGDELGSQLIYNDPKGIISAIADSPSSPIFDEKQHINFKLEVDRTL